MGHRASHKNNSPTVQVISEAAQYLTLTIHSQKKITVHKIYSQKVFRQKGRNLEVNILEHTLI